MPLIPKGSGTQVPQNSPRVVEPRSRCFTAPFPLTVLCVTGRDPSPTKKKCTDQRPLLMPRPGREVPLPERPRALGQTRTFSVTDPYYDSLEVCRHPARDFIVRMLKLMPCRP